MKTPAFFRSVRDRGMLVYLARWAKRELGSCEGRYRCVLNSQQLERKTGSSRAGRLLVCVIVFANRKAVLGFCAPPSASDRASQLPRSRPPTQLRHSHQRDGSGHWLSKSLDYFYPDLTRKYHYRFKDGSIAQTPKNTLKATQSAQQNRHYLTALNNPRWDR